MFTTTPSQLLLSEIGCFLYSGSAQEVIPRSLREGIIKERFSSIQKQEGKEHFRQTQAEST